MNIIILLLVVIALVVAAAYLLPQHVIVQRSVSISAPPGAVFPWLNSLKRSGEWSPWMDRDPDMQVTYDGPEEGVGAKMAWTSDKKDVGQGRQEITVCRPDERVESALDFGPRGTARAWFDLAPEDDGTKLTWVLDADMGASPIGRYMGLMMDRMVGPDYEKGLGRIKSLAEDGG